MGVDEVAGDQIVVGEAAPVAQRERGILHRPADRISCNSFDGPPEVRLTICSRLTAGRYGADDRRRRLAKPTPKPICRRTITSCDSTSAVDAAGSAT
jgi:hypothetical protein